MEDRGIRHHSEDGGLISQELIFGGSIVDHVREGGLGEVRQVVSERFSVVGKTDVGRDGGGGGIVVAISHREIEELLEIHPVIRLSLDIREK